MKNIFNKIFRKNRPSRDNEYLEEQDLQDSTGEAEVYDIDKEPSKISNIIENIKQSISVKWHRLKHLRNKNSTEQFNKNKKDSAVSITWKDELEFYWKKLQIEKLCSNFYSPESRKYINTGAISALLFIGLYQTGKISALLVRGVDQTDLVMSPSVEIDAKKFTNADFDAIRSANLFKTDMSAPVLQNKPAKIAVEKCEKADRKSALPIKLVNTIVLQDSVKSLASVQVRSSTEHFRTGEKIQSLAKVDKIEPHKLIIKNLQSGECEYLEGKVQDNYNPISVMSPKRSQEFKAAQKAVPGIKNKGNDFTISKKVINDQLKNLSSLLTQAKAIKIVNPDGSLAFKLVEVEPGGIFATLGVQNEDIIKEIDGRRIDNMNQIMSLFSKLKNLNQLNLTIERGGTPTKLNYKFQ